MRIFISYRRHDSQHTSYRIADRLRTRYGRENVFIDIDNLPAGVDFRDAIKSEIESCDVVLVVIGPAWTENREKSTIQDPSDWVRIEVETALQAKVQTIPVLVEGAKMPDAGSLPAPLERLAYLNAASIGEGRDFHNHVDWLIASIDRRTRRLALFSARGVGSRLSFASLAIIALVCINLGLFFYYRQADHGQSGAPQSVAASPPISPPPVSAPPASLPPATAPPLPTPSISPPPATVQPLASPPSVSVPPATVPPASASAASAPPAEGPLALVQQPPSPPVSPPEQASPSTETTPAAPATENVPVLPTAPDTGAPQDVCTVGGLDPNGNNWLALRDSPSLTSHWSDTRMGPGTKLNSLGTSGPWRHVRLQSGEEGWASSRFLSCGDEEAPSSSSKTCSVDGLDPNGNNWLALRRRPSFKSPWSKTHMGPGTPVTILDISGVWRHVRIESGEEGWANGQFIRCE